MININTNIVEKLNELVPTYYELYLDGNQVIPCCSYQIITNSESQKGNLNGYSNITVRIKLWATRIDTLCDLSSRLDDKMAELGPFTRLSVGEMTDGDLLCWIFDYSILLPESYNSYRV